MKTTIAASLALIAATAAITAAVGQEPQHKKEFIGMLTLERSADMPVVSLPRMAKASAVSTSLKFYEDFESVSGEDPYSLPDGWTSVSNPANPSDEWHAGGPLYLSNKPLPGTSGMKYAFILPDANIDHDTWMFTPAMELDSDVSYKMSANVIMLFNNGIPEDLDIVLCKAPTPADDSQVESIIRTDERSDEWTNVTGYINVEESGTYYLGFHAISLAGSGGMVVDDVAVMDIMSPVFYGKSYILMDDKFDFGPETSATYSVWNDGYMPLEIELKSCSPEITVSGLPMTIDAEDSGAFSVTLDVNQVGFYQGEFVLSTNDPLSPEVRIKVYQDVKEAVFSEGYITTFDRGTPQGFVYASGSANVIGRGINGSRAPIGNTYYGLGQEDNLTSITTNFVLMGDHPRLSFWYRANMTDNLFKDLDVAAPEDHFYMSVRVSSDFERTWKDVYTLDPNSEKRHNPVLGFQYVDIDMSEFADETCRVKIMFGYRLTDNQTVTDILRNMIGFAIDNLTIGTVPESNLGLAKLIGPTVLEPGKKGVYTAVVENLGVADHDSSYEVMLRDGDGNVMSTSEGKPIGFGEAAEFEFEVAAKEGSRDFSLTAEITGETDPYSADNISIPLHVAVLADDIACHTITETQQDKLFLALHQPIAYNCVNASNTFMYLADEFGINRGEIHSLVLKVTGDELCSEPIQVYVGETLAQEFGSDGTGTPDDMTLVFDSEIFYPSGEYELVIPFYEPYEYKGGNLVVRTVRKGREYTYGRWGLISLADRNRSVVDSNFGSAEDADFLVQNQYPWITLNMTEPDTGSVSGMVVDEEGNPLSGAAIAISGECMTAKTDAEGRFSFSRLAEGEYTISGYLAGFGRGSSKVSVTVDETSEMTITLHEIAKVRVSGVVKDINGVPLKGSTAYFKGETPATAVSDADGVFEAMLYSGKDYSLTVTSPFYSTVTATFSLGEDEKNFNCTVMPDHIHPYAVKADISGGKAEMSWSEPIRQLRHDTGDYESCLGYTTGWSEIIFGSAYHEKAMVKEVSWYMSSEGGSKHSDFNVFVFGLTDGKPDADKILYRANGVDFRDDAWNTHVLSTPVEADGFMVAVSCTGFMGIGYTEATDAYPYTPDTEYFAGDSFRYTITEIGGSSFRNCHWMLRAGVDQVEGEGDVTRPEVIEYTVMRKSSDSDSWVEVGRTAAFGLSDSLSDLPEGRYRWAAKASYESGESHFVMSPDLYFDGSSVVDGLTDSQIISYSSVESMLHVDAAVSKVAVWDASGLCVMSVEDASGSIDASSLAKGMHTAAAILSDGTSVIIKFMR